MDNDERPMKAGNVKGYFKIKLDGIADHASPSKRTGEQRLALVEKELRKQGIPFVEDFDNDNTVIVRYGAYCDDAVFEATLCPDCGEIWRCAPSCHQLTDSDANELAVVEEVLV